MPSLSSQPPQVDVDVFWRDGAAADAAASRGVLPPQSAAVLLQVDVDTYRRAAGQRRAPLPGAACFTAEALSAWRELNTAADFTEVAAEIHNLASNLPLLLHHKVGVELAF